jgi:hypothetical protein
VYKEERHETDYTDDGTVVDGVGRDGLQVSEYSCTSKKRLPKIAENSAAVGDEMMRNLLGSSSWRVAGCTIR